MNNIVENFLSHLKSKQLNQWSIMELEDHAFCIQFIYRYLDIKTNKEERRVLNDVYRKIADWVNNVNKERGTVINPSYLIKIDKDRGL